MTLSLDFEIIWISNNLHSGAPVKSLRLIIWHVTCCCLFTCIACVKMCVCPVQMRVCTRGTWFQLSVTVSAGTRRRPRKNSSSNNSKGWRYTAEIIAVPSCILEGTYVCLSLLLSTVSTTVAETKENSAPRVPRGGELPRQAWLMWRLISQQCTGVVSL